MQLQALQVEQRQHLAATPNEEEEEEGEEGEGEDVGTGESSFILHEAEYLYE
jgi:hypothetical protein